MSFEKFENTGRMYRAKASIWSRGQMGLNNDALKEFGVKKDKDKSWYVTCHYDKENNKIGLKFTQDMNEKGILKVSFRTGGCTLSTKMFLDYYKIDHSSNKRYDITYDPKEQLYVIDLNEGKE